MEQTEQQKKVSLIPYLMKYKWHYLAGIVLLLVVDLANLYVPRYMGDIIDGLTEGAFGMEGVIPLLWKILAAGAAMMVGRFGWRYFIFGAARGIEYRLRDDMFSHLETLSARYFNSHKTGDLMAHFTNDLQAVRMAVGPAVVTVFDAVVMTVMVLFQMVVYVDLQLTVLAFVPLTLVAVGCYFYGIEAKKRQTRRQEAFSSLSDKVQESLSGVRVLKAFVQEEEDFKAFARASENVKEKNLAVVKLRAVFGPSLDAVTGISLLLTLIFGGKMVLAGTISVGQFVAFTTYISMLVWPMIACGDCINMFSQASAAFQRISCIFREEPDIVDREGGGDAGNSGADRQRKVQSGGSVAAGVRLSGGFSSGGRQTYHGVSSGGAAPGHGLCAPGQFPLLGHPGGEYCFRPGGAYQPEPGAAPADPAGGFRGLYP